MFNGKKYILAICLSVLGVGLLLFTPITQNVWPQDEKEIKILIDKLKDPNASVRANASIALGNIGPDAKAALPSLTEVLQDEDKYVREGAGWAIEKINAPEL